MLRTTTPDWTTRRASAVTSRVRKHVAAQPGHRRSSFRVFATEGDSRLTVAEQELAEALEAEIGGDGGDGGDCGGSGDGGVKASALHSREALVDVSG